MCKHRGYQLLLLAALSFAFGSLRAEISDGLVKIGVLTDMSGPYAAISGAGSVLAARMAVEDFGADKKGLKVEIVEADNKNKVEVATGIVRQWYDIDKVDAVVDIPNSAIALAVSEITREKNRTLLLSGTASSQLTGKACSPNTVHWTYDTWALANGTGSVVTLSGGKTWYFITVDYAFGHALERDTEMAVLDAGGHVFGAGRYPLNSTDLRSYLKDAQASNAKIVALANAGAETIAAVAQSAELGFRKQGLQLAGLLVSDTDVHTLGLEKAQGLLLTAPFYWNLTPGTRSWSQRFFERHQAMPTYIQAGVYASVLHYLKAIVELRSDDGRRTVAKMKELQTNDPLFGVGYIRQDGRKIHRLYLFEVKKPAESRRPWDYYKLRGVIPAETAFRPLKDGGCPLVNALAGAAQK
jgi:branched-chain amino acid transport system substrate-binding protein